MTKMSETCYKCLITIFVIFFATAVKAEIFQWKDNNGIVHYSDKVPSNLDKSVNVQHLDNEKYQQLSDEPHKEISFPFSDEQQMLDFLRLRVSNTEINEDFFKEFLQDATIARDLAQECYYYVKKNKSSNAFCSMAPKYLEDAVYPKFDILKKTKPPEQYSLIILQIKNLQKETRDIMRRANAELRLRDLLGL